MSVKYFCDWCEKEISRPIDYVDVKICKCHMCDYDIEFAHFIVCPKCRKKILEKDSK